MPKSIETICALLDANSTYIPNTAQIWANQVREEFVRRGWKPAFIESRLAKLDDTLLEGWKTRKFMEEYAKATIQQYDCEWPTIKESMLEFGVCEEMAQKAHEAMEPLHDTCYTRSQMVDVALEYLIGRYDPICP